MNRIKLVRLNNGRILFFLRYLGVGIIVLISAGAFLLSVASVKTSAHHPPAKLDRSRDADVQQQQNIKLLQQMLFNDGYLKIVPTGYFGNATRIALLNWQKDRNIAPDVQTSTSCTVISPNSSDSNSDSAINIQTSSLHVARYKII